MKRIKTFGGMLCAAVFVMGGLLATSCNKTDKENSGEQTPEVKDPVTFTVEAEASYYSATVTGTVSEIVADAEYGVVYGTAENPEVSETTPPVAIEIAEDKTFTIALADLTEGTTYHYRAYICEDGAYTYSDDATFATKAFPVAEIAETIAENSAVKVTFKEGLTLEDGYEIGVEYSSSSDFSGADTRVLTNDDYDEGKGVYVIRNDIKIILFSTTYCRSYVKDLNTQDKKYFNEGTPIVSEAKMTLAFLNNIVDIKGSPYTGFKGSFSNVDDAFTPSVAGFSYGTLVSSVSEFDINTEGVKNYSMTPSQSKEDMMDFFGVYVYTDSLTDLTSDTYYRGYIKYNDKVIAYTEIKELTL